MKKKIILCIIISLFIISSYTACAKQENTIEAKPNEIIVSKGQEFEIELFVILADLVNGIAVNNTAWDPSLAECKEIIAGNIFPDYIVWIPGQTIDNEKGLIQNIVLSQKQAVAGEGTLAIIKFKAIGDGIFKLNIPPGEFDAANLGVRAKTVILSFSEELKTVNEQQEDEAKNKEFSIGLFEISITGVLLFSVILILIYLKKGKKEMPDDIEKEKIGINENIRKKSNIIKVIRDEKNRN
jgi:hypothetical protein